jgi:hypothetical protein
MNAALWGLHGVCKDFTGLLLHSFVAPGAPQNLRILGSTTSQLKVGWEPPEDPNGVLKGYYVYNGELCQSFPDLVFAHNAL